MIEGRTEPSNPLFTPGGSFWTNDSFPMLDLPAAEDPRFHPRNRCILEGFASLALIPIRARQRIVGLLQLNARRKDQFSLTAIHALEGIATHIGEAFLRSQADQELKRSLHRAEELAVKAEAATRAKSEFLAVMSHELRTPLNGVLGFAELLAITPLDEDQMGFVKTITQSGEHLLSLVNDILDFSSIESDRMVIESATVILGELVESSCLSVRKTAFDKGLECRSEMAPDVPATIQGDSRRLRQILINLLGNAVKFTAKGSIHFRVSIAAGAGRPVLEFSIEDTGPGIPDAMLDLVFEPFTQVDSTLQRNFEGAGIGLTISQRLARAMGGSITLESTVGKGSVFTFHLPLGCSLTGETGVLTNTVDVAGKCTMGILPMYRSPNIGRMPMPLIATALDAPPLPAGGLVLVVEDDPDNSRLAGKMLESLGYRVEFAADGAEAVEAFVPGKFFAILMDMQMPVMDGIGATKKIRAIESGTRVPIIALTANAMPGDRDRCLAADMDDYLSKPYKREELAARLASCPA